VLTKKGFSLLKVLIIKSDALFPFNESPEINHANETRKFFHFEMKWGNFGHKSACVVHIPALAVRRPPDYMRVFRGRQNTVELKGEQGRSEKIGSKGKKSTVKGGRGIHISYRSCWGGMYERF